MDLCSFGIRQQQFFCHVARKNTRIIPKMHKFQIDKKKRWMWFHFSPVTILKVAVFEHNQKKEQSDSHSTVYSVMFSTVFIVTFFFVSIFNKMNHFLVFLL